MRRQPVALARARLITLYLISLEAVYGSYLSWRPEGVSRALVIAWPPLVLGAAALGGAFIYDRLGGLVDRSIRARLRSIAGLLYAAVLFLVVMGLLAGQREAVDSGGLLLRALQPAFLLFAGFGRGYLGTLVNAFALTATSVLAGGPGAALSVALHGGLVAFFLAADHPARMLTEYPVGAIPRAEPILARGFVTALAIGAGLGAFFWAFPPLPYAPLRPLAGGLSLPSDRLAGLLANLFLMAMVSSIGVYLLLRLGGGRGPDAEGPIIEIVSADRRTRLSAAAPYVEPLETMGGWRSRIVKLYVRTTAQLAKWGHRRRPYQTPREFARTLVPSGPAVRLAELFGRARYGSGDLTEADYEKASQACRELLDHHRRST